MSDLWKSVQHEGTRQVLQALDEPFRELVHLGVRNAGMGPFTSRNENSVLGVRLSLGPLHEDFVIRWMPQISQSLSGNPQVSQFAKMEPSQQKVIVAFGVKPRSGFSEVLHAYRAQLKPKMPALRLARQVTYLDYGIHWEWDKKMVELVGPLPEEEFQDFASRHPRYTNHQQWVDSDGEENQPFIPSSSSSSASQQPVFLSMENEPLNPFLAVIKKKVKVPLPLHVQLTLELGKDQITDRTPRVLEDMLEDLISTSAFFVGDVDDW